MMLEAKCRKCGEIFIPHDENDIDPVEREDGQPCGGVGDVYGAWEVT